MEYKPARPVCVCPAQRKMAHEGRDAEVLLTLMTLETTNKSVGARGGASTSNAKRTKGPLPVLPATRLLLSYELSARTWAMLGLSTPRGFSNMSDNDTGVIAYTAEGHLCMRKCSVRTMCGILARYLLTHGTYAEHHEGRTAYHLACALSLIDEQSISDDDLYDEHAEGARELEPARSYFTTDMLLGFLRAHGYTVREAVDDLPSTGRPTDPAELRYAPLAYAQSATSSPPLRNLAVGEECGPESSQKPTSSYWIRGGERGEVIFSKSLPLPVPRRVRSSARSRQQGVSRVQGWRNRVAPRRLSRLAPGRPGVRPGRGARARPHDCRDACRGRRDVRKDQDLRGARRGGMVDARTIEIAWCQLAMQRHSTGWARTSDASWYLYTARPVCVYPARMK